MVRFMCCNDWGDGWKNQTEVGDFTKEIYFNNIEEVEEAKNKSRTIKW